ncbi:hypothetical protein V494_03336 [Pseudogymnoascus sp. VKM F-4513 (FW-928)]|nr:hypothetical protein V494_03336 [Pseudogymnoascus sp. VKM F-4513 (FW-928)]
MKADATLNHFYALRSHEGPPTFYNLAFHLDKANPSLSPPNANSLPPSRIFCPAPISPGIQCSHIVRTLYQPAALSNPLLPNIMPIRQALPRHLEWDLMDIWRGVVERIVDALELCVEVVAVAAGPERGMAAKVVQ